MWVLLAVITVIVLIKEIKYDFKLRELEHQLEIYGFGF